MNFDLRKATQFTFHQIQANRGLDLRFVFEAIIKALIAKSKIVVKSNYRHIGQLFINFQGIQILLESIHLPGFGFVFDPE